MDPLFRSRIKSISWQKPITNDSENLQRLRNDNYESRESSVVLATHYIVCFDRQQQLPTEMAAALPTKISTTYSWTQSVEMFAFYKVVSRLT